MIWGYPYFWKHPYRNQRGFPNLICKKDDTNFVHHSHGSLPEAGRRTKTLNRWEFLSTKLLPRPKTNMSHENRWLEDVCPYSRWWFQSFFIFHPRSLEKFAPIWRLRIFPKSAGEKPPPSIEIVPKFRVENHSFLFRESSLSTSKPPPFKVENVTISTGDYMFPRPWGASTR